jgi:hypothetical protein
VRVIRGRSIRHTRGTDYYKNSRKFYLVFIIVVEDLSNSIMLTYLSFLRHRDKYLCVVTLTFSQPYSCDRQLRVAALNPSLDMEMTLRLATARLNQIHFRGKFHTFLY